MNATAKYAAFSAILLSAACGVIALGFAAAGDLFARSSPQKLVAVVTRAEIEDSIGKRPTSRLLGAKAVQTAEAGKAPGSKGRWVEVVDAVNMRKGPTSATEVTKVQLPGAKLRVASREGAWVEVVEPKAGGTGWALLSADRTMERKKKEARLALALELRLSKDEILERYLSSTYFGQGCYGLRAAAKQYFDTTLPELTVPQSAYLVGLLKSSHLTLSRRPRIRHDSLHGSTDPLPARHRAHACQRHPRREAREAAARAVLRA